MNYQSATLADLVTILKDSIIRYKGVPVVVNEVLDRPRGFMLAICPLTDRFNNKNVSINSKNLDYTPVPLGYCNSEFGAEWLYRRPARSYRQGLHSVNIGARAFEEERSCVGNKGLYIEEVEKCIRGVFPSLQEAIKVVRETGRSCAFSRSSCIRKDGRVFFKSTHVANIDSSSGVLYFRWGFESMERIVK